MLACVGAFAIAERYHTEAWTVLLILLAVAVVFGGALTGYTLRTARNNVRSQKMFISNVAHELRTPLSTIKTSTEVALLDERLPADAKTTFNEILEELARISEIINNLLSLNTLTRPERIQFQNLDLFPIADRVVKRHAALARERGIRITLKNEPNCIVWGNASAVEQVMMNLVKNALSYTPADSRGRVSVTIRPDTDDMVLFCVEDTGIGMSQQDLFHIFEPFYRVDTSRVRTVKKSGSGLGLTIVNEMIRAHHGRIQIQSARGKGTTVSVYIPRGGWAARDKTSNGSGSQASLDFSSGSTHLPRR